MKTRKEEMREQWLAFHYLHPKVWEYFERFTLQLIARGFKHYSAHGIAELVRFHTDQADVDGRSTWKFNNNFVAFYSRLFMDEYPEHEGFFRTREQTSGYRPATYLPPLGPEDYPDGR